MDLLQTSGHERLDTAALEAVRQWRFDPQLRNGEAVAGSIAADSKVAVRDARSVIAHVKGGRGTLGALVMDEALYDDLQEMLRDLKHNPWKFFWRE